MKSKLHFIWHSDFVQAILEDPLPEEDGNDLSAIKMN